MTAIAGFGYAILTSESSGPALSGNIRCGAKGNPNNCGGVGCHGGNGAGTTVHLTVDSVGGHPITSYAPGQTYSVTVSGNNASLTFFGFQFAAVKGSGASQTQAGTFSALPSQVGNHLFSGINFIEQTSAISAPSGTYTKTFSWTAPAAGTGNVTMYLTLNAVNGNGSADNGDISNAITPMVLTEQVSHVALQSMPGSVSIRVYPNPAADILNVQSDNAANGNYSIQVFDITGRSFASQLVDVTSSSLNTTINTSTLATGRYFVVIEKDNARQVIPVVKQ